MNGLLHGDNVGYYPGGAVQHRFTYREGKKVGTNFEYYPDGQVSMREVGTNNGTDLAQYTYTENQMLISEKKFRNEKPHGTWTLYFPGTRIPSLKETYENGKLSGMRYTYHPSGKIAKEETYKFDLLAGPLRTYYEDGQLESLGEYRNSRKHGLYTAYYPGGKIREQGEYIADKKHKTWTDYDEQGNVKDTLVYRAGILVPQK
jgi:antitoxin component YwqK of YwqJK toxin-antitoxin module